VSYTKEHEFEGWPMAPTSTSSTEGYAPASPRRRATRADVRQKRAAVSLVLPLNRQIGHWQSEVAQLLTACERAQDHEALAAVHYADARSLEDAIRTQVRQFTDGLVGLPKEVTTHSRVRDTLRAVESVLTRLEQAKGLLEN
jgi:hypothetical protein